MSATPKIEFRECNKLITKPNLSRHIVKWLNNFTRDD